MDTWRIYCWCVYFSSTIVPAQHLDPRQVDESVVRALRKYFPHRGESPFGSQERCHQTSAFADPTENVEILNWNVPGLVMSKWPLNMVIFHSYVGLPEGNLLLEVAVSRLNLGDVGINWSHFFDSHWRSQDWADYGRRIQLARSISPTWGATCNGVFSSWKSPNWGLDHGRSKNGRCSS